MSSARAGGVAWTSSLCCVGSSLESQRTRLMRSALKMDIPPDRLPADMRDTYLQMTNASPSGHMEAALRPGCTHLVAICLIQVPSLTFTAPTCGLLVLFGIHKCAFYRAKFAFLRCLWQNAKRVALLFPCNFLYATCYQACPERWHGAS